MPSNQFFNDWVTGDIITADKLNQMKNEVQPYLGQVLVDVEHGEDSNTRYYYLGRVFQNDGFVKVQGIFGGEGSPSNLANIDLQFTFTGGFRADGYVTGRRGSLVRSDIIVKSIGDNWGYIYLVTQPYALVKLNLARQGMGQIWYNGTYSNNTPDGSTIYQLNDDLNKNTHPNTLKLSDGILQARYDHQNRFVMNAYLGGATGITIDANTPRLVTPFVVKLPAGKLLYLKRLRVFLPAGILPRMETSYTSYTLSSNYGNWEFDIPLSDYGNDQNYNVYLYAYNSYAYGVQLFPWEGYTVEFEIR